MKNSKYHSGGRGGEEEIILISVFTGTSLERKSLYIFALFS